MTIESKRVALFDIGLKVRTAGAGNGRLCVLLHGFPESSQAWSSYFDPLAADGFQVVAPDLRGYGDSDKPKGRAAYRLEALVDDVKHLIESQGHQRAVVVGHDWGGVIAWWTALVYPEIVDRLVILNAPHPTAMNRLLRSSWAQLRRSWYIGFFQLPWLPERLILRDGGKEALRRLLATAQADAFSSQDQAAMLESWNQAGAMTAMLNYYRALVPPPKPPTHRVEPPTLLLWGKRDVALQLELAQQSLAFCSRGELAVLDEATHWIHREYPSWVLEKILAFSGA